jgi:prepilin-type N-terminal cleavage/methylation domain-containing protein
VQLKRAGFTMVELLASIAIVSVIATATTLTLIRQERFYSRAEEVLDVKSQLRDAADVLASDIRGSAVATYGVPLMTDSAIELYTTIGTSVTCAAPVSQTFGLAPSVLANGNTLTSLLVTPDTGDLAEVYTIPSANLDSAKWEARRVASFASRSLASSCPSSTGFTTPADVIPGAAGYQLVVAGGAMRGARKGAPIRFLRRARYSIYKSSDNLWYLGYRRCAVTAPYSCGAIQPVSGPYRAYRGGVGGNGLSFRYYDTSGVELAPGSSGITVARVEIVIVGQSSREVALVGDAQKTFRDSVIVTVSPRNRRR